VGSTSSAEYTWAGESDGRDKMEEGEQGHKHKRAGLGGLSELTHVSGMEGEKHMEPSPNVRVTAPGDG